ncbi:MAG: hypothetical protein ACEY3H_01420 [Wolbachia sp.]
MKEIPIYEKSSNQPIAAGVVGALLLVSCVAFYFAVAVDVVYGFCVV